MKTVVLAISIVVATIVIGISCRPDETRGVSIDQHHNFKPEYMVEVDHDTAWVRAIDGTLLYKTSFDEIEQCIMFDNL